MAEQGYTPSEMMTIVAARFLDNDTVCFVGIGQPSAAANLARLTHAPDAVLIYESGTMGTKAQVLPLSIGDGELAETSDFLVSVPEMFRYWLQGERITLGFLGAAQIDRYANLNTTVIGDYDRPRVRLPGAGGAPEIAASCAETLILLRQSRRTFVEALDFVTTVGHYRGGSSRREIGLHTRGPKAVITDLCLLEPDPESKELTVTQLHPGSTVEEVREQTGWELRFAPELRHTPPPTELELATLRDLNRRTEEAHAQ